MSRRCVRAGLVLGLAASVVAGFQSPSALGQVITLRPVQALQGVFISALADVPDNPRDDRFFALDLAGKVRIVRKTGPGPLAPAALDFSAEVPSFGDENGALGLALHPRFSTNGYVYIFYSRINLPPVLVRYTAPLTGTGPINPATRTPILTFPTFSSIHISGCLQFGPDGYLYITHGDNGASGNAQALNTTRGKVLRIDVDDDDFPNDPERNYAIPPNNRFATPTLDEAPEIWSIGVRNTWRFSFDRVTGEFYGGDVGDSTREEINRVPAAAWQGVGGVNFGWPCYEGNLVTSDTSCSYAQFPYQAPLIDFTRAQQMQCVVGGYVYRGCAAPGLVGRYLFGNCFSFNQIRSINPNNPAAGAIVHSVSPSGIGQALSFAQDRDGEVYVLSGSGPFRITGLGTESPDCNNNAITDACEIARGLATDFNNDGVPDVCTQICPADFNGDEVVSVQDIFDYLSIWFQGLPAAEFNGMGGVTVQDIFDFLEAWFAGCL